MADATKEEICEFVKEACEGNTFRTLYLCTIDATTVQRIKKHIPLTFTDYEVIITEEYVRHVRNGHKEDLEFICLIPEIIYGFDKVDKTVERNKRTGHTEIFAVFEKQYSGDVVKLVKMRDMKQKSLSLKTIFRKV